MRLIDVEYVDESHSVMGVLNELDVRSCDTLVFSTKCELSDKAYNRLRNELKERIPRGTKLLLLEGGIEMSVLRFEE